MNLFSATAVRYHYLVLLQRRDYVETVGLAIKTIIIASRINMLQAFSALCICVTPSNVLKEKAKFEKARRPE
jgi:hypothetical protein